MNFCDTSAAVADCSCFIRLQATARVTQLFSEELRAQKRTNATRASHPPTRDYTLFGAPSQQHGLERLLLKKSDLRNKFAMRGLAVELLWQEDGTWWPATITQVQPLLPYTVLGVAA